MPIAAKPQRGVIFVTRGATPGIKYVECVPPLLS